MTSLGADYSNPQIQKNPSTTYDPQVLFGTIPVAGSLSNTFDCSGWSEFALLVNPGNGTIAGTTLGTVMSIYGAPDNVFVPVKVLGTTGAVASTFQIGSTGQQIVTQINTLKPLRFVQFGLGGTQSQAVGLALLVK